MDQPPPGAPKLWRSCKSLMLRATILATPPPARTLTAALLPTPVTPHHLSSLLHHLDSRQTDMVGGRTADNARNPPFALRTPGLRVDAKSQSILDLVETDLPKDLRWPPLGTEKDQVIQQFGGRDRE
jgi:hypothetical protein